MTTQAPPSLRIREIAPAEFELVWPMFRSAVAGGDTLVQPPDTTEDDARRYWTTPPARAFVATIEGTPVGSSMIRPNQPGLGDHVANAGYVVDPAWRGRGIARALCEHSLATAAAAGFTAMQFNFVVATNESAIHVWQSCGFEIVGRLPGAFRHARLGSVDALVMFRSLEGVAR